MAEPTPLHGLDLNLLITLRALLRTSSVTRAAERMGQTQPTVSRSLATLRVAFGDPLLVRAGRGMVCTPFALALRPRLEATLESLARLSEVGSFDPSTARHTWKVVAPDLVSIALQPAILVQMEQLAPGCTVRFLTLKGDGEGLLLAQQADLVVGPPSDRPELRVRRLSPCGSGWSVVFASEHPLARGLSLEGWLRARHVALGEEPLDALLQSRGLERRVAAVLPTLSGLSEVLAHSQLVASLPTPVASRLAEDRRLVSMPHPFGPQLAPLQLSMVWHHLHDATPAHRWFRGAVHSLLEVLLAARG